MTDTERRIAEARRLLAISQRLFAENPDSAVFYSYLKRDEKELASALLEQQKTEAA